jgi:putative transposase
MIRKNRKRNRKEGFDYSQDNIYIITICVQNRICCLGSIPVGTGRDLSTNHNRDLSTNHNRDLSTNHNRDLSTNHNRDLSTNHNHDLSTNHNHDLSTNQDRDLSTNHNHDLSANQDRDLSSQDSYSENINKNVINKEDELQIELNEFGKIAKNQVLWLEERYPYVVVHCFVIMPNHVHILLEIDKSLVSDKDIKIKSLSELIGAYKTTSSKQIHLMGLLSFAWQRSFHDHIVRNEIAYERIFNYIESNPLRWYADTFFAQP